MQTYLVWNHINMNTKTSGFIIKTIKLIFIIYLGLFLTIWGLSSPVTKYVIEPELNQLGLDLSDESRFWYNPFMSRISVKNVVLTKQSETSGRPVFSLEQLTLQASLWQLLNNKVSLPLAEISGGYIKIDYATDAIEVAGVRVNSNAKSGEQKSEELPSSPTQQQPIYTLMLPNLDLSNFRIDIDVSLPDSESTNHQFDIAQFALRDVSANAHQQSAQLDLAARLDNIPLKLNANMAIENGLGELNSELSLDGYQLNKISPYIAQVDALSGALSVGTTQSIEIRQNQLNIKINEMSLQIDNVSSELQNYVVELAQYSQSLKNIKLTLEQNQLIDLTGNGELTLAQLAVKDFSSKDVLLGFEALNISDISLQHISKPEAHFESINLLKFVFSKKQSLNSNLVAHVAEQIERRAEGEGVAIDTDEVTKLPHVLALDALVINEVQLTSQSIDIERIEMAGIESHVILKKDKSIANLVSLTAQKESRENDSTPAVNDNEGQLLENQNKQQENEFRVRLGSFEFAGENSLHFTDFSVEPIYQRVFYIDTLTVGELDNKSASKNNETPIKLIGRSNKYAKFELTGHAKPFADIQNYYAKARFSEFSLPAISSYLRESTGLEVKTGQFNTDFELTLNGQQLDGDLNLLVRALETGIIDSDEVDSLIDQGALPLNMAMGILKDSDGNVALNVPVSGSTDDPKFGLSSIVTLIAEKAIISATQDYLMQTFVPYANIVSVAFAAGEIAFKLRFDDLGYLDKQVEPNEMQTNYLNEFILLMQDKQDTRVRLCAVSTPADLDLASGVEITDKKVVNQLKAIGEQREVALKDYLINVGKIESSRLLLCQPTIDTSKGAKPRIAISV